MNEVIAKILLIIAFVFGLVGTIIASIFDEGARKNKLFRSHEVRFTALKIGLLFALGGSTFLFALILSNPEQMTSFLGLNLYSWCLYVPLCIFSPAFMSVITFLMRVWRRKIEFKINDKF